jgi:hypothetical protein
MDRRDRTRPRAANPGVKASAANAAPVAGRFHAKASGANGRASSPGKKGRAGQACGEESRQMSSRITHCSSHPGPHKIAV